MVVSRYRYYRKHRGAPYALIVLMIVYGGALLRIGVFGSLWMLSGTRSARWRAYLNVAVQTLKGIRVLAGLATPAKAFL